MRGIASIVYALCGLLNLGMCIYGIVTFFMTKDICKEKANLYYWALLVIMVESIICVVACICGSICMCAIICCLGASFMALLGFGTVAMAAGAAGGSLDDMDLDEGPGTGKMARTASMFNMMNGMPSFNYKNLVPEHICSICA
jgi:hypothetical protein